MQGLRIEHPYTRKYHWYHSLSCSHRSHLPFLFLKWSGYCTDTSLIFFVFFVSLLFFYVLRLQFSSSDEFPVLTGMSIGYLDFSGVLVLHIYIFLPSLLLVSQVIVYQGISVILFFSLTIV